MYVRVVPGSLVRWLRIHVDSSSATASSSFIACLASSTHEVVSFEKACMDRHGECGTKSIKVWGGSVNFALRTHASAVAPPLTRLARPCRPHSTDMIHVIGPVMHPSYK